MNQAPKGRKRIAQGKASLRAPPWVTIHKTTPPFPAKPGERSEHIGIPFFLRDSKPRVLNKTCTRKPAGKHCVGSNRRWVYYMLSNRAHDNYFPFLCFFLRRRRVDSWCRHRSCPFWPVGRFARFSRGVFWHGDRTITSCHRRDNFAPKAKYRCLTQKLGNKFLPSKLASTQAPRLKSNVHREAWSEPASRV
jgi:hypothetical protein